MHGKYGLLKNIKWPAYANTGFVTLMKAVTKSVDAATVMVRPTVG